MLLISKKRIFLLKGTDKENPYIFLDEPYYYKKYDMWYQNGPKESTKTIISINTDLDIKPNTPYLVIDMDKDFQISMENKFGKFEFVWIGKIKKIKKCIED